MSWTAAPASLGPACAFFSSVTWAVGSAGYSRLSRSYSPFAVNLARAFLALPLFILAAFISAGGISEGLNQYSALKASHFGWFTLSMVASYGLGDVLFLWSTRSLGVPGALAIASAYPLWTATAGVLFRGEHLFWFQWLGLLSTVSGVGVVIVNSPRGQEENRSSGEVLRGVLLAVLTSVFWSLNSFAISQAGREVAASVGNSIRMVLAILISFAFGKILQPKIKLVLPLAELQRSFWLFALEAFGGSLLFMYGLSHSPLAVGSTLSSLAPVISVPAAWFLGLEKFSLFRTVGVLMAVFGVILLLGGQVF